MGLFGGLGGVFVVYCFAYGCVFVYWLCCLVECSCFRLFAFMCVFSLAFVLVNLNYYFFDYALMDGLGFVILPWFCWLFWCFAAFGCVCDGGLVVL